MKLLRFLADLATDEKLMYAFRIAPHEVSSTYHLSEEEERLLLAGDPIAIARAVETARHEKGDDDNGQEQCPSMTVVSSHEKPPDVPPIVSSHGGPPWGPPVVSSHTGPPWGPPVVSSHTGPPGSPTDCPPQPADDFQAERDIAQDAVLAVPGCERTCHEQPGGVWSAGGLTVVGLGMRAGLHLTTETRLAIEQARRLLYLSSDPVSDAALRLLNPCAVSIGDMYAVGKRRTDIYEAIVGRILSELEEHGDLCVAFYGHPGVLCDPAWESIRRARAAGKRARMLPAISTEDCLFADLGIDIGRTGLQSYEATRFLYSKYNFDPGAGLLLWQLGVLGEYEWNPPHPGARPRLQILATYLEKFYPPDHDVFLYHAPQFPTSRPMVEKVALSDLPKAEHIQISTLYLPPVGVVPANEQNLHALKEAGILSA